MPAQQTSSRFEIFVEREREFAHLREALEEASDGRGRLLLVSGEPGIGKTRLADEVAKLAKERGVRVLWGRCWEGGGVPAYWPWIQVVRALVASLDPEKRHLVFESEHAAPMLDTVAQIVPELFAVSPLAARPQRARHDTQLSQFRLFDSVATLLKDAACLGPLVIVLDDLYDADIASLSLLRFVAREVKTSGILILGTYREAEVQRSPSLGQPSGT